MIFRLTDLNTNQKLSSNSCLFKYGLRCLLFKCVLLLSFFFFQITIYSQDLIYNSFSEKEGLTKNAYWGDKGITIDENGEYWIVSEAGLNRYNGYENQKYFVEANKDISIPNQNITCVVNDKNGNIWFGTSLDGIFMYNFEKEIFNAIDSEKLLNDSSKLGKIYSMCVDSSNRLWISSAYDGIYVYDIDNQTLDHVTLTDNPETVMVNFYGTRVLSDNKLLFLSDDYIFIGTQEDGFEEYEIPRLYENPYHPFRNVELPNGNIMVGTYLSAQFPRILNRKTGEVSLFKDLGKIDLIGLFLTPDSTLWIKTVDNLYSITFPENKITAYPDFPYEFSSAVLDKYGNVFYRTIGEGAGRFRYAPYSIEKLTTLPNQLIKQKNENEIYISSGNEMYVFDMKNDSLYEDKIVRQLNWLIHNFEPVDDGTLWALSEKINQDSVDLTLGKATIFHLDPNGEIISKKYGSNLNPYMKMIGEDLWVENHIYFKDLLEEEFYYIGDKISKFRKFADKGVRHFRKLKNGELWIATLNSGVFIINKDETDLKIIEENGAIENGLNSNNPQYIFETQDNRVYVLTDKGFNIWNPKTQSFSYLNRSHGLEDYAIKGIGEDQKGNVWFFAKDKLYKHNHSTQKLGVFAVEESYRMYNQYTRDMIIDSLGRLYYHSYKGLFRFDPEKLNLEIEDHNIVITDLYVGREKVYPDDDFGILTSTISRQDNFQTTFDQRDLGFKFVAVDGHLSNLTYYYRLKGYHKEWIKAPSERTIHFTNLDPGHYTFQVKAITGGGEWLEKQAKKSFRVLAPWYRTLVAYGLYTLFAFLVGYGIYRYRINQLLKYQMLRTKISSDLHDDVGTLLSSVAMQSEILGLNAPPEKIERFARLGQLSREAMSRMRDTVWAIDSRKDDIGSLVDRMQDYLYDMFGEGHQLKYKFLPDVKKQSSKLPPDVRQNVYLIFKEAVNNAMKYSNGDSLKINLLQNKNQLVLSVKDNGKVDNSKIKTSGTGLSNMKMRAERIAGKLEIKMENGFEVRLVVGK